jgi:hypothetical protein
VHILSLEYDDLPREWKQQEAAKWKIYFDDLKVKVQTQREHMKRLNDMKAIRKEKELQAKIQ